MNPPYNNNVMPQSLQASSLRYFVCFTNEFRCSISLIERLTSPWGQILSHPSAFRQMTTHEWRHPEQVFANVELALAGVAFTPCCAPGLAVWAIAAVAK